MIDAKDLRIGNYVQNGGHVFQVKWPLLIDVELNTSTSIQL